MMSDRHAVRYTVRPMNPAPRADLNPLGAGRCAYLVRCECGKALEGRANTKGAAEKRARELHRQHARDARKAEARLFEGGS